MTKPVIDLKGNTLQVDTLEGTLVGDLTGDLTGDVTGGVTGDVVGDVTGTVTGDIILPVADVTAVGSAQGDGAALSYGINVVVDANGTKAVVMPEAAAGRVVVIKNEDAGELQVFPAVDDSINAGAADAVYAVANSTAVMLFAEDAVNWFSVPLLAS